MISRYALYDIAALSKRFLITQGLPKGIKPNYAVAPNTAAPVVIVEEGQRTIRRMNWGLLPAGAKDKNSVFRYKSYATPSETVFSRHSVRKAVHERRCIVPANGFYELSNHDKSRAFYAKVKNDQLRAFAGIYASWQDADGNTQESFSVLTTEATGDMPYKEMRMPIILRKEDEARWLDGSIADVGTLYSMVRPNDQGLVAVYEVGPEIHSAKQSSEALIRPLAS